MNGLRLDLLGFPVIEDTGRVTSWNDILGVLASAPKPPVRVSTRTLRDALEATLMGYTRTDLEVVLGDELKLEWPYP